MKIGRVKFAVKKIGYANQANKMEVDKTSADEKERGHSANSIFDKPNDYFNLEKIRKSLGVDRRISVRDLMELIFGKTPYIKNKYELLEEEFEKFDYMKEIGSK